jgi:two-component system, OmpR family, KDP operon response regulator KdpE
MRLDMCNDPNKPRILFADDDAETLQMLVVAAHTKGWCAQSAETAEEILQKVTDACAEGGPCYDMIVSDVNFFSNGRRGINLTGIGAGIEIRSKFKNLPILFLTGWDGPMTRANVRSIGNADILQKPVSVDELFERIETMMNWQHVHYTGPERRHTSINQTGQTRRGTDVRLKVPDILEQAMQKARKAS